MDVKAINETFDFRESGGVLVGPLYSGEGGTLSSHWHEELEIVYVLSGEGSLHYINGKCYDVNEKELLIINSDFVHSVIPRGGLAAPEEPVVLVMIISASFLKCNFPSYNQVYFTNDDRTVDVQTEALLTDIGKCVQKHAEKITDVSPADMLHRNALILELLSRLSKTRIISRSRIDSSRSIKEINRIKEIVEFIEENYAEPLTRETVAEHFFLNRTYFSSYFKKYTGMTFTQYLTNYRLMKASDLLLHTDETIGDIALKCGFSDHRGFIGAFRKRFDETPSHYRKNRQK